MYMKLLLKFVHNISSNEFCYLSILNLTITYINIAIIIFSGHDDAYVIQSRASRATRLPCVLCVAVAIFTRG